MRSFFMNQSTLVFLIMMGVITVMFAGAAWYAHLKMKDRKDKPKH